MQSADTSGKNYSGWAAFAGAIMFIVGSLDALWGLGAILNDNVVVVGGHGAIIADITTWGWVHLILGSAIALTGLGLLLGNTAARWAGVLLVTVNAISQIVWFPAAPLWAFLMIILDVTIIYQLTARWDTSRPGTDAERRRARRPQPNQRRGWDSNPWPSVATALVRALADA